MRGLRSVAITLLCVCIGVWSASADEKCDPLCINHYRNCEPAGGLPADKDVVIDCRKLTYKLKCPVFCDVCTPCDNQDLSALESLLQGEIDLVNDRINEMEEQFQEANGCAGSADCQNGGSCEEGYCSCPEGTSGSHCEKDEDECATSGACPAGITCTNTQGSYECDCGEAKAYKDGLCQEAAQITGMAIVGSGGGPGEVTLTITDMEDHTCTVSGEITASSSSGAVSSFIHGVCNGVQYYAGAEKAYDGDVETSFSLYPSEAIQLYIGESTVASVKFLTKEDSIKDYAVQVCTMRDYNWRFGLGCKECQGQLALLDSTGWKEVTCDDLEGDSVRLLNRIRTLEWYEVETSATSKRDGQLLGFSGSSGSTYYTGTTAENMYQPYYEPNWSSNYGGKDYTNCFCTATGTESNNWAKLNLAGVATVKTVRIQQRTDCCPEHGGNVHVSICDGDNCQRCGITPRVSDVWMTIECNDGAGFKGDRIELSKKEVSYLQICQVEAYGDCEKNDCDPTGHSRQHTQASLEDVYCPHIVANSDQPLKAVQVVFQGEEPGDTWTWDEIQVNYNGKQYVAADDSNTVFGHDTSSMSYYF